MSYKPQKVKSNNIQMHIMLHKKQPIYSSPRRLAFAHREVVDKQVEEWLNDDIITPCVSEYASPVLLTTKKDGSPRLCIDYRRINRVIMKDKFSVPLIQDILDRLQDAKIFTTIDLKNGFFSRTCKRDQPKIYCFCHTQRAV